LNARTDGVRGRAERKYLGIALEKNVTIREFNIEDYQRVPSCRPTPTALPPLGIRLPLATKATIKDDKISISFMVEFNFNKSWIGTISLEGGS
jgi:hypothetical protein